MRDDFNMKQRVDELGKFIAQWPWQIWATLTFRNSFRISNNYLKSQWDRWISLIRKLQGRSPYWIRSVEIGTAQDNPHFHVLLGDIDLPPRELPRLWHPRTGNARAEVYDLERRAPWYLAKDPESVEFSSNLVLPEKW